jgi:glyoxylase-like metal-dependent hydrolase (beta-lactamase superfamily II)
MAQIYSINTGFFWLDGGTLFGVVPRVLWERHFVPDRKNRVRQTMRAFLIVDGDRKIIVDPGLGNWYDQTFYDRYKVETPDFDFDRALLEYNLSSEEITDVIITHLHFDHAGGLAARRGTDIVPVFPNARIWLQEKHWRWAQNPSAKDRGSFMGPYMDLLQDSSLLELVDGEIDITADVSLLPFHGHTPAMQSVVVKTSEGICWCPSDLIPFAAQLRVSWIMAYDNNSVVTAEEKEKILRRVKLEKWTIYFYHDPVHEKLTQEQISNLIEQPHKD